MINLGREPYNAENRRMAREVMRVARETVYLDKRGLRGFRFHCDSTVLAALESQTPEEAFMLQPLLAVELALREVARADYWYENEKEYDVPNNEIMDEDDE